MLFLCPMQKIKQEQTPIGLLPNGPLKGTKKFDSVLHVLAQQALTRAVVAGSARGV